MDGFDSILIFLALEKHYIVSDEDTNLHHQIYS